MEIFDIDGKKYTRSPEPFQDGDEVYCILDSQSSKVPYGTKGRIASVQYDRVEFLGHQYIIFQNETAKLIEIK